MRIAIPSRLETICQGHPEREEWFARLPSAIGELIRRWGLSLSAPFDGEDVSCSWVAPVSLGDGRHAVLKLGMPHFEGEDEVAGLRFWAGDPTVQLLDADSSCGAMLLERCVPGTALWMLPEPEQDVVIAGLLKRMWRMPSGHGFRPLSEMFAQWTRETIECAESWPEPNLVEEGLRLFQELSKPSAHDVLLATDLHAGNVLRAEREPWLVIDPKPFIGDPAYDATQHLFNCSPRLTSDPDSTIGRFSDLLGVDHERVRMWTFARAAAEPRKDWSKDWRSDLASAVAAL